VVWMNIHVFPTDRADRWWAGHLYSFIIQSDFLI